jgi:multidrug resistance efflux pump
MRPPDGPSRPSFAPYAAPPIPVGRRLRALWSRLYPVLFWLMCVGVVVYLDLTTERSGHGLAFVEVEKVRLTPGVDGLVTTAPVDDGRAVEAGQELFAIEAVEVDDRMAVLRAEIARLGGAHGGEGAAADAGPPCEADPSRARLELDNVRLGEAQDQGELDGLGPRIAKLRGMVDRRLVTAEGLDELVARKAVLQKRLAAAAGAAQQLEACLRAANQAEIALRRVELAALERARVRHTVRAPAAGTLDPLAHRAGEWVTAGTELGRLSVVHPDRVVAYFPTAMAAGLTAGAHATLRRRDDPGASLEGRVVAVAPAFEEVPPPLRAIETRPEWGRRATIQLDAPGEATPGAVYTVGIAP